MTVSGLLTHMMTYTELVAHADAELRWLVDELKRVAPTRSLNVTAKMNAIDPQAWLVDVLAHIAAIRHQDSISSSLGTGSQTELPSAARYDDHCTCRSHRMLAGLYTSPSRYPLSGPITTSLEFSN